MPAEKIVLYYDVISPVSTLPDAEIACSLFTHSCTKVVLLHLCVSFGCVTSIVLANPNILFKTSQHSRLQRYEGIWNINIDLRPNLLGNVTWLRSWTCGRVIFHLNQLLIRWESLFSTN